MSLYSMQALYLSAQQGAGEAGPSHSLFIDQRMNVTNNKLPYEAPAADAFQLSAAPLNICVQFSGEADFNDFEEGEAL